MHELYNVHVCTYTEQTRNMNEKKTNSENQFEAICIFFLYIEEKSRIFAFYNHSVRLVHHDHRMLPIILNNIEHSKGQYCVKFERVKMHADVCYMLMQNIMKIIIAFLCALVWLMPPYYNVCNIRRSAMQSRDCGFWC